MRLTHAELDAIAGALGFILAGEPAESAGIEDEREGERFVAALESAHTKVTTEIIRRDNRKGAAR